MVLEVPFKAASPSNRGRTSSGYVDAYYMVRGMFTLIIYLIDCFVLCLMMKTPRFETIEFIFYFPPDNILQQSTGVVSICSNSEIGSKISQLPFHGAGLFGHSMLSLSLHLLYGYVSMLMNQLTSMLFSSYTLDSLKTTLI